MTYHSDDYAVWPDGFYLTLDEMGDGMPGRSDDYEIVRQDNTARLAELGVDDL